MGDGAPPDLAARLVQRLLSPRHGSQAAAQPPRFASAYGGGGGSDPPSDEHGGAVEAAVAEGGEGRAGSECAAAPAAAPAADRAERFSEGPLAPTEIGACSTPPPLPPPPRISAQISADLPAPLLHLSSSSSTVVAAEADDHDETAPVCASCGSGAPGRCVEYRSMDAPGSTPPVGGSGGPPDLKPLEAVIKRLDEALGGSVLSFAALVGGRARLAGSHERAHTPPKQPDADGAAFGHGGAAVSSSGAAPVVAYDHKGVAAAGRACRAIARALYSLLARLSDADADAPGSANFSGRAGPRLDVGPSPPVTPPAPRGPSVTPPPLLTPLPPHATPPASLGEFYGPNAPTPPASIEMDRDGPPRGNEVHAVPRGAYCASSSSEAGASPSRSPAVSTSPLPGDPASAAHAADADGATPKLSGSSTPSFGGGAGLATTHEHNPIKGAIERVKAWSGGGLERSGRRGGARDVAPLVTALREYSRVASGCADGQYKLEVAQLYRRATEVLSREEQRRQVGRDGAARAERCVRTWRDASSQSEMRRAGAPACIAHASALAPRSCSF